MKKALYTLAFLLCCLFSQAQSQFWVSTTQGGSMGHGAILKSDISVANFQVIYSFDGTNGAKPLGNLCEGGNGKLYGVTELGGYGDSCVVYSFDTTTYTYFKLHDFDMNHDSGYAAVNGMIRAADGMLYGVTQNGGNANSGVIYRVNPINDSYSPVYSFDMTHGSFGHGSLVQLSDGKLYGMTKTGGLYDEGVIFSFDPVDSVLNVLYQFHSPSGSGPLGSIFQANDGKLYGMTADGGAHNRGVVFSFDMNSSLYTVLHDFSGSDGGSPNGSVMQASNGLLYGMTPDGGTDYGGIIFSYDINASQFSVLYNLDSTNGKEPQGRLVQASNGKLYGTGEKGGYNNGGVVFTFDINNSTYQKIFDFGDVGCSVIRCDLLEGYPLIITNSNTLSSHKLITLYPSPALDHINLDVSLMNEATRITISDMIGKQVSGFNIQGNTLNIAQLPVGAYFLRIQTGNEIAEGKFLKE